MVLAHRDGPTRLLMYEPGQAGEVSYIRRRWRSRSWLGSFVFVYIYTAPLWVVVGHAAWRRLEGRLTAVEGLSMQDPGYELPRIPIARTRVNKGKRKRKGPGSFLTSERTPS